MEHDKENGKENGKEKGQQPGSNGRARLPVSGELGHGRKSADQAGAWLKRQPE